MILAILTLIAALENTWVTSPNNTLDSTSVTTSSKNQLWMMGAALTGNATPWVNATGSATPANPWTIWCSSNGVTYPLDDCTTSHTDNLHLGGAYTAADWVRNATDTVAHSYYVLKSPAAGGYPAIYMLVTWNTASDQTVTISFSKTLFKCSASPCTAATGSPTQANKWSHTAYTFNVASVTTQNRLHFSVDSYGSFWFEPSRDGNGFSGIRPLVGVFLKDYKTADVIPFLTTVADPCYANYNGGTQPANVWADYGTAGMGFQGRRFDDGAGAQIGTMGYNVSTAAAPRTVFTNANSAIISGTDGIDGKWDDLPIYLFDGTSNALRGRLPDFRWGSQTITTGSVGPSPGPYTNLAISNGSAIGNCTSGNNAVAVWFPYANSSTPIF